MMRNHISPEQDGQKGLSVCPSKRLAYWVISQLALCCPLLGHANRLIAIPSQKTL